MQTHAGAERPPAFFRLLCVITHHVFDRLGEQADDLDIREAVKYECALAHLDYGASGTLCEAVDAVKVARAKGYRTPLRPGRSRRPAPNVYHAPPPFTRDELNRAERWRRNVGQFSGCPHTPTCADWDACQAVLIRSWRRVRRAGS